MMVCRLKLLRDLLSDEGVLLISIDDNEISSLLQILNEIFGDQKHLGTFVWRRRIGSSLASSWFSADHEYVIAYSKTPDKIMILGDERDMSKYSAPDGKGGFYASMPLTVGMNRKMRPNQWYELKHPKTGTGYYPPEGRVWCYYPPTMEQKITENKIIWPEDYPDKKLNTPRLKSYPEDAKRERKPLSSWIFEKNVTAVGDEDNTSISSAKNEEGSRILKDLLGESGFNFPKPLSLLLGLLRQFTNDNDIILDSFAGSGTTMHAVMDLNKEDGGNRKCIMVQMTEATEQEPKKNICKDITRERVKRAIEKYGYKSGFKYLRVGDPIDAETLLSGTLPTYKQFAKYVYYLCTGGYLQDESSIDEKTYFVGMHKKEAIYLIYKKDYDTLTRLALNLPIAEKILKDQKDKKVIVYAPACFLDEEYLEAKNMEFVGIPYNLFRRNGQ
jgi:adenine-specific DNA-methyltransferase